MLKRQWLKLWSNWALGCLPTQKKPMALCWSLHWGAFYRSHDYKVRCRMRRGEDCFIPLWRQGGGSGREGREGAEVHRHGAHFLKTSNPTTWSGALNGRRPFNKVFSSSLQYWCSPIPLPTCFLPLNSYQHCLCPEPFSSQSNAKVCPTWCIITTIPLHPKVSVVP